MCRLFSRSPALAPLALIAMLAIPGAATGQEFRKNERPGYGRATTRTLDVDPAGVDPQRDPGRCFKIHYAAEGPLAPDPTDESPRNEIPDYIDRLAQALATVYAIEVGQMGWPPPPSDANPQLPYGGDGRYDVYVTGEPDAIGSIHPFRAVELDGNSFTSYMTIDRDVESLYRRFSRSGPGDLSHMTQADILHDLVAHEYFHAIQFGLVHDRSDHLENVAEATANWINDYVFNDYNVNVKSMAFGDFTLFTDPARSLHSIRYGGWFWYRYLSERYDREVVRDLWDGIAAIPAREIGAGTPYTVTSGILAGLGTSLRSSWTDFCGKLDARQWFSEGPTYPDLRASGVAMPGLSSYPVVEHRVPLIGLARHYLRFEPPDGEEARRTLRLRVRSSAGEEVGGVVVLETADGRRVDRPIDFDGGNGGSISISGFGGDGAEDPHLRVTSVVLGLANARLGGGGEFTIGADLLSGPDPAISCRNREWGYRSPLWQSSDLWVDNDGDCSPGTIETPIRGRTNRLCASIRNLGDLPAAGVRVRFSYAPLGVGLADDDFAEIGARAIDLAGAGDDQGLDRQVVSVDWDLSNPEFDHDGRWDANDTTAEETVASYDQFTLRVTLEFDGDVNPANNSSRSDLAVVPTGGATETNILIASPPSSNGDGTLTLRHESRPGWLVGLTSGGEVGNVVRVEPSTKVLATLRLEHNGGPVTGDGPVAELTAYDRHDVVGGITILPEGPPAAPERLESYARARVAPAEDDQDASPLLLITPGPGLDYARLRGLVTIVDHYFELVGDERRHHLIALDRSPDLAGLDDLPIESRTLTADASIGHFRWIPTAPGDGEAGEPRRIDGSAPQILARRTGAVLVQVDPQAPEHVDAPHHGPPAPPLDLSAEIDPERIAPGSLDRNARLLAGSAGRARRPTATVKPLVSGVDPARVARMLRGLTGVEPIQTRQGEVTIESRLSTDAKMDTLIDWLVDELRINGLDAQVESFDVPFTDRPLRQVVATIPGSDMADQLVLVTAHLDAVAGSPGADDNASGVAAVVEAARQLAGHRFRRSIRFVAFNAEEQGLFGSGAHARRLAEDPGVRVVGVLNLDMVGFDAEDTDGDGEPDGDRRIQLQTDGTAGSDRLVDFVTAAVEEHAIDLKPVRITDPEQSSDYASFWREGFPAINIGDEYFLCDEDCVNPPDRGVSPPEGDFHPHYHRPGDTLEAPGFSLDLVVEVTRAVIASVADLAEMQEP